MSTDSTDPTHAPGIAGDADADAPHPQAPEGPGASGTHNAPKVSPSSLRGRGGSDSRRRLVVMHSEVGKAVVGQEATVTGLIIALFVDGHILFEGVPGVAKTLLVRSLATTLDLKIRRIQFTPDLMPGDVTNSFIYNSHSAQSSFRAGPILTNLLLADEISHTPPKVQLALLEAVEERQVSIDSEPRVLPDPFMVIITQDPVEYEGTYPLSEAQLDCFLLELMLPLPERAQEIEVLFRHTSGFDLRNLLSAGLRAVAGVQELAQARVQVSTVGVTSEVLACAMDLVRATRPMPSTALGISPHGVTAFLAASRAWAWLAGRSFITPDDIEALALPVLRHHIKLHAEAEMEGITPQSVIEAVL